MTDRRDRYGEPEQPAGPIPPKPHDPRCRNGWLRGGDAPAPCPTCKPWLAACRNCGKSKKLCEFERRAVGVCCPECPHNPPVTNSRRRRSKTKEASG